MGWSAGTSVAEALIEALRAELPSPAARERVYRPVIRSLWDQDWDTEDEVRGLDDAFDAALDAENEALRQRRVRRDEG